MTESHGIKRSLVPWTELTRGALECRVYCKECGASNMVTGNDNPFFWRAQHDLGFTVVPCGKCRTPIRMKRHKAGIELL